MERISNAIREVWWWPRARVSTWSLSPKSSQLESSITSSQDHCPSWGYIRQQLPSKMKTWVKWKIFARNLKMISMKNLGRTPRIIKARSRLILTWKLMNSIYRTHLGRRRSQGQTQEDNIRRLRSRPAATSKTKAIIKTVLIAWRQNLSARRSSLDWHQSLATLMTQHQLWERTNMIQKTSLTSSTSCHSHIHLQAKHKRAYLTSPSPSPVSILLSTNHCPNPRVRSQHQWQWTLNKLPHQNCRTPRNLHSLRLTLLTFWQN